MIGRGWAGAWLVLAGLGLALGLAACSGPGTTTGAGGSATYRSADYHFTLTYDPRLLHAAAELNREAVPAGSPPQLDWTSWPVSMGSHAPDVATRPYMVGVSAVDFEAAGMTPADFARDAAQLRSTARSAGGSSRAATLGGATGYRAQWSDGVTGYHYVIYRLVAGRFDYTVAVVCRVSDWPEMRGPLLAVANSFQVLQR